MHYVVAHSENAKPVMTDAVDLHALVLAVLNKHLKGLGQARHALEILNIYASMQYDGNRLASVARQAGK